MIPNHQAWRNALVSLIGTASLAAIAAPQNAMRFEAFSPCLGNGSACAPQILATGVIEKDSAKKLAAFIAKPPKDSFLPPTPTIMFDSPGGSVPGGIALGNFIRSRGLDTMLQKSVTAEVRDERSPDVYRERVLAKNAMCASACTLAFVGGVTRAVEPGSRFGVHQFYSTEGNLGDGATQITMTYLAGYVESMGVSRNMLDLASTTAPEQMHWIPDATIRELRIDNVRPSLTPWRIDADANGVPSLVLRQQVGPNRELYLLVSNGTDAGTATIVLLVAVQRDAPGQARQDAYPVGAAPEISFKADGKRAITAKAVSNWSRVKTTPDGSAIFRSSVAVTTADLRTIAAARKLSIDDDFSNAVRDMSLATELSTTNLQGGVGLLLRSR